MEQDGLLDDEHSPSAHEPTLGEVDAAAAVRGSGTTLEVPDSEGEDEGNDEGDRWEELLAGSDSSEEKEQHTAIDGSTSVCDRVHRIAAVSHASLQPAVDVEVRAQSPNLLARCRYQQELTSAV